MSDDDLKVGDMVVARWHPDKPPFDAEVIGVDYGYDGKPTYNLRFKETQEVTKTSWGPSNCIIARTHCAKGATDE